nr:IS3 family transposase [Bifidobacterium adolescentis]
MQDTGRSPLHLLLDDRGIPAERADPITGDVRAIWRDSRERHGARKIKAALERRGVTASRRRIGNIMREQGMTSAYARRRSEPHRTRADEARLANLLDRGFEGYAPHTHPASDLTYVRGRQRVGVRVSAGRPGEQGHRRPFRRADPGRKPGIGRVRHPRLPADGRPGVPHRPGRRVRRHGDRRAARRVRRQRIAAAQG